MKLATSALLTLLCAGLLVAQGPFGDGAGRRGGKSLEAVQETLMLNDAQIEQMRANQKEVRQAMREVFAQNREKRNQLRELMQSDNPDAFQIGQLTLELRNVGEQVKEARAAAREKNLMLLDEAQKERLQALTDAAALAPSIHGAAALNLIEGAGFAGRGPGAGMRGRGGHGGGPGARGARGRGPGAGGPPAGTASF